MIPIISGFQPKFAHYFYELNVEWLNSYYFVTPDDELLLTSPDKIVEKGGEVFFAIVDDNVVGTCAMMPETDKVYELIKMGVNSKSQGKGVGSSLMKACIDFAIQKNADKIILETALPLKAAIHLYEKFGFVRTSDEYTHPVFKRVTFKMELSL